MTEADVKMIKELEKTVEHIAGKTVSEKVMQGSEHVTKSSKNQISAGS